MATNSGVRIDRNDLTGALTIYQKNLQTAAANAVDNATAGGVLIMKRRLLDAHTRTGLLRQERGTGLPGRVRSGRMLRSIRTQQQATSAGTIASGAYKVRFGFIDSPSYTIRQENDPQGVIPPMMAFQAGWSWVQHQLLIAMADEMKRAGQMAQAQKLMARARRVAATEAARGDR